MKASELLVRCLEREGVRWVFGIPGEENLDLLEALRSSDIELVLTRHEQAAGFMAATVGRLTGRPGVCLSTLGPGATNFATASAYALLGGMPMLMITGQKPIKKSKQGRFQIVDVVAATAPLTKWSRQIVDPNNVPHLVREAFRLMVREKPGPVLLELPEDVAAEATDRLPFAVTNVSPPAAGAAAIERAVELIRAAKRPLVCVASGANRQASRAALSDLLERTELWFFSTQMGKGVIDERHPRFLGTAALSDNDYLHCAIERADLVVIVGHDVTEKPPFFMHPDGKIVIHVANSEAQMDDVYFPQHEVIGCIASNLRALAERLTSSPEWDFGYFERVHAELEEHVYGAVPAPRERITPQALVRDVREAMPDDGIVSLDNGIYKVWFARNYRAREPNTLLLDNALATMGAGLPVAIAAKLIHPERRVLAVAGDGGFMMSAQELETAVRLRVDLTILILRDDAYGMIKWKQEASGFPTYGLDFGNPDFVRFAEAFGAHGHRVGAPAELSPLLARCLAEPGVHVIDVPIDYSENQRVLVDELRQKVCLL